MMALPKIYNPYYLAFVATLGGMLFGFDISSMSAIVGTKQYLWYFDDPHGITQGAIGSSLAAGSVVGALFAGPLSDRYGRRDTIAFSTSFWILGTIVQVTTKGVGQLIAGRILNGVTVGITSSQVPVYLAEISKKNKRGQIVVIQQLAIEFGILVMFFIGYGCKFWGPDHSSHSFRLAWGIQLVPAVMLIIGAPFLPRSPRWLAKVGRDKEAIEILAKIQAGGDSQDPLVVAEWEEIVTVREAEKAAPPGLAKWYKNGMWKRTFAGASVQAWQQLSGANVMVYYMVYVFSFAGVTGDIGLISSGIQYALFILFSIATFFFIDHTGRRPLLIYGAIGMGVCHFVVGGTLATHGYPVPEGVDGNSNVVISMHPGAAANTVIAFSYLLIIVYALTLAPVAWVYASEVWSLETRAYGMSLASLANWLFNFALGLFVPPAFRNITWKIFIIFGVLCMGAALQAFVSYPETARKSLEEIEEMFRNSAIHPWQTAVGGSQLEHRIMEAKKRQDEAAGHPEEKNGVANGTNGSANGVTTNLYDEKTQDREIEKAA